MAFSKHPKNKIITSSHKIKGRNCGITVSEVTDLALNTLLEHLPISRPEGAIYDLKEIFSVILYASSHGTTIEQAARSLKDAPHPNTVGLFLKPLEIEELEREVNSALVSRIPRGLLRGPLEVAIDIKLIPYYGEPREGEEDFIIRSAAKDGTNTFFAYASIYVIRRKKRFTLALKAVRRSEGIVGALIWLLLRFSELGGIVKCLYLDREFYSVKVIRFLKEERGVPFVIAAPKRGKKGGINGLIEREGCGIFPYTVRSPRDGEVSVSVATVKKNLKGKWGRFRRETYAYVIHLFPFSISSLFERYRRRFGIESSHRIWDRARARTASQSAVRRFLLLGIAVLLYNLWVFVKWMVVKRPCRGGQGGVPHSLFTFYKMCSFIRRALEERYGFVEEVVVHV